MEERGLTPAPLRTVVIGAGNVASHLAPALEASGAIEVEAVWSRTVRHAEELAAQLRNAAAVTELDSLPTDAGLYLMSVADDAVSRIASGFKGGHDAVWLHTSGSVEASVLSAVTPHYGVLYPLQTFTRGAALDLSKVPFFIEGADEQTFLVARRLADAVSTRVYEADSALRSRMHVAAVFACNFTNYLWSVADDLLKEHDGLDITLLGPLLEETIRKSLAIGPLAAQTGPARRGDRRVIDRHLDMLDSQRREIYEFLTDKILSEYERN